MAVRSASNKLLRLQIDHHLLGAVQSATGRNSPYRRE